MCEAVFISLSFQSQDGSKAAEGLALASNALDAAKPLVAEAEEANKAADAARSEMRDVSRHPPLPCTAFLAPVPKTAANAFQPKGSIAYV